MSTEGWPALHIFEHLGMFHVIRGTQEERRPAEVLARTTTARAAVAASRLLGEPRPGSGSSYCDALAPFIVFLSREPFKAPEEGGAA